MWCESNKKRRTDSENIDRGVENFKQRYGLAVRVFLEETEVSAALRILWIRSTSINYRVTLIFQYVTIFSMLKYARLSVSQM